MTARHLTGILLNCPKDSPFIAFKQNLLAYRHRGSGNSGVLLAGIAPTGNLFAYAVHQYSQFCLFFKGHYFHVCA